MIYIKTTFKKFVSRNNLLISFVFLIYFIPRIIGLGSDMANIDTMYWYPRMEVFTRKLLQGDFKATYQQYHPGTTLLWMSGFSKYTFQKAFEYKYKYDPTYIPHQFIKIQFASTFPLVFVISILGTLSYWIISKLHSRKLALIFSVTLSLEPFFLGISKYLHLTALSTMFGFAGFLIFLYFLKYRSKKSLIISGILAGLAISTKVSVLIFQPIIGLSALYVLLMQTKNKKYLKQIWTAIYTVAIQFIIAAITFFVVNPFMWVAPIWGLKKIYNGGIVNTGFGGGMPDTFTNSQYLYYLETAFIRTTPILFIAFLCGFVYFFIKIKQNPKDNLFISTILLFILYYLFLSIPSKLKDRYYVEMMPGLILIASYGIYWLINNLNKLRTSILIGVYILYMGFVTYTYYPAFSFYHTELIGGPKGLLEKGIRPTNRGEWYAQAAQFLNTQDKTPETKNILMGNESLVKTFAPFYYGTTYAELGAIPDNKGHKVHYIITRNLNQKYVPQDVCPFFKGFGTRGPLAFDNVFVFKCDNILKDDLTKLIPTFPDY